MFGENSNRTTDEKLAQVIRNRINLGTWGRIHQLQVELHANRVIVNGLSPSYYLIQLALRAVREVLPSRPVKLDIQIAAGMPHAPEGVNGSDGAACWRQDLAAPSSGSARVPGRRVVTGFQPPVKG
jgi:hypothetical protein